ncbi:uncharacterized protein MYCGRDRAFT_94397 [Zymoseptoria tritici IPO323]|uniref:Uncharacterized protein n=1 Tax=Zymoseptoria tritici (strain CBS 115943 / IPO323) TaxID=336722 RepID=F9XFE2_ZYMTI|nr:uncharacterized protein MYCGRDRAFT_94397 [Zymoseptoria tritici IPO323]EGP86178.1 hypothetical protein MYCGRDRAFT_94397 [Zymoseptoria tritici IPO323]
MPPNTSQRDRPSTWQGGLIILACVLLTQFGDHFTGTPLPQRLTSLYMFAACFYCIRAGQDPALTPLDRFEVFVIIATGIAAQLVCLHTGSVWMVHLHHFVATVVLYIGAARPFERG